MSNTVFQYQITNKISSPLLNLQSPVLNSRFKVVPTSDSIIAVLVGLNWHLNKWNQGNVLT